MWLPVVTKHKVKFKDIYVFNTASVDQNLFGENLGGNREIALKRIQ
jgi:hypothetical protein